MLSACFDLEGFLRQLPPGAISLDEIASAPGEIASAPDEIASAPDEIGLLSRALEHLLCSASLCALGERLLEL